MYYAQLWDADFEPYTICRDLSSSGEAIEYFQDFASEAGHMLVRVWYAVQYSVYNNPEAER
jgi:hypothetical protein